MRVCKVNHLDKDLLDIIYKVAEMIQLQDITYLVEFGVNEIDYFLSGIQKVNIKGKKDGACVKIGAIIKWHSNPVDRMCFRAAYQREYVFYQYVVPKMLQLQRKYQVIEGLRLKFPNCIFASNEHDKETIVISMFLQYALINRFHKIDFVQSSLVIKSLAKLHGLSFALEYINPEEFQMIRSLCERDVQYYDTKNIPKSLFHYFKQSIDVVSDPVIKAKLEAILPHISTLLSKCSAPVPNYSTICHGDCWSNNILLKYKGKIPAEVLFVDFQLMRYASPVTDLSYYFYMSADREFLSKHYDRLLNVYYGTLSGILRQVNLDVANIYPRNIFEKHLREYSVLGLLEALVSMKIITAESEEALKMTEIKYQSLHEDFPYETQNHTQYVERVNGVVNDFFERKYSLDFLLNK